MEKLLTKAQLEKLSPVDISEAFESFTQEDILFLIESVPKQKMAEIFYYLEDRNREALLETLINIEKLDFISKMDSDELADIMQELPANVISSIIKYIPEQRRKEINQLLRYGDESVGSLMTLDLIKVKEGALRKDLIGKIKSFDGKSDNIQKIYVVNHERQLTGYINTPDLLRNESEEVEKLVNRDVISATAHTDKEEAARLFSNYHLLTLPVVDEETRLLGIITADDIFEVIEDELYEDMAAMQGMALSKKSYLEMSSVAIFKERITWLLILMVTATFTGIVIKRYDDFLAANALLAAYIPMLMDSGGNAGSQSSTTIIRAISQEEITVKDWREVVFKELKIGSLVALTLMCVNFLRVVLMDNVSITVAAAISITLGITIVISKLIGAVLPLAASNFGQNPAVMTGPLLTTLVDTVALLIYFETASLFVGF